MSRRFKYLKRAVEKYYNRTIFLREYETISNMFDLADAQLTELTREDDYEDGYETIYQETYRRLKAEAITLGCNDDNEYELRYAELFELMYGDYPTLMIKKIINRSNNTLEEIENEEL